MLELGMVLTECGDLPQANMAYDVALRQNPRFLRAALAKHLTLPMIYADVADVARARQEYVNGLETLERELDDRIAGSDWRQVVNGLAWSNFFLAYQGENDKQLQSRYAALTARALDSVDRAWRVPMPVEPAGGTDSRRFCVGAAAKCTVGRYFARWVTDLDRSISEVCVYSLSAGVDEVTTAIAARADRIHAFGGVTPCLDDCAADSFRARSDVLVFRVGNGSGDLCARLDEACAASVCRVGPPRDDRP